MKSVLILLPLFLGLAACSAVEDTQTGSAVAQTNVQAPSDIQISVVADDFAKGSPRIPFVLYSGTDQVADASSVHLTAFDLSSARPVSGWSGDAVGYNDYEVPYWVVFPSLPHAGTWGLEADIMLADGTTTQAPFAVQVSAENRTPAIGSLAPASENRTLSTEADLTKLTSGQNPLPGLYQTTVSEAIQSGRPTVVTLATPAFCQTAICAPVVESVESVFQELGDQANFIHIEIYKDFQDLIVADEVEEWGLTSEPWTFVLDGQGRVVARLGGPVSPRELLAALTPLLQ